MMKHLLLLLLAVACSCRTTSISLPITANPMDPLGFIEHDEPRSHLHPLYAIRRNTYANQLQIDTWSVWRSVLCKCRRIQYNTIQYNTIHTSTHSFLQLARALMHKVVQHGMRRILISKILTTVLVDTNTPGNSIKAL
jgi:hypothetical protein